MQRYDRQYLADSIRAVVSELRVGLSQGGDVREFSADDVMARVHERLAAEDGSRPRRIVNATGVVLHTNIGRAALAADAVEAVRQAASGAIDLELDVASGRRGDRESWVRRDLAALTGAPAVSVVNNNAAAVLLALNSVAEGREVIVSRGELVEIGGSFRIPDVMAKSGAVLREVGTTNRTHPRDYAEAINERTALLLKVHTSNYRIVGFTCDVDLSALVAIGRERGVPVMEDLGSGALVDLSSFGLPREPVVRERVEAGADVVTFSGDKLLGGPQAGLIVGREDLLGRIADNPLKRALRCDKMTLAALAATLRIYRSSPHLSSELPTLRWLTRPPEEMEALGKACLVGLRTALGPAYDLEVIDDESEIGSGALPIETLPTKAIAVGHPDRSADAIAGSFREADPCVLGRIRRGRFVLDLRCIVDASELIPNFSGAS